MPKTKPSRCRPSKKCPRPSSKPPRLSDSTDLCNRLGRHHRHNPGDRRHLVGRNKAIISYYDPSSALPHAASPRRRSEKKKKGKAKDDRKLTITSRNKHLKRLACFVRRAPQLALVGGVLDALRLREERAAHHDGGVGVGARRAGGIQREALEVDVDW